MSSSVYVAPLHLAELDWARSATFSHGVPEQLPPPVPLPLVVDVLAALTDAKCHGTPWFEVRDLAARLPTCPDPATCKGLDLGEVSFHAEGDAVLRAGTPVETVSFRKPSGRAVLHAACALTVVAGPVFVFDDSAARVFVIQPGTRPEDIAARWPW